EVVLAAKTLGSHESAVWIQRGAGERRVAAERRGRGAQAGKKTDVAGEDSRCIDAGALHPLECSQARGGVDQAVNHPADAALRCARKLATDVVQGPHGAVGAGGKLGFVGAKTLLAA